MFQKNIECHPVKKMPTWRKLSMALWGDPKDPSVYGTIEVDMTKALALVEAHSAKTGQKLSTIHLVIKATAKTIEKYPDINVVIRRNKLYQRDYVDIFTQVFFKEGNHADLSGAKIRDAQKKTLEEIAAEVGGQARQIKDGKDPNLKQTKGLLKILSPRLLRWMIQFIGFLTYDLNWRPKILKLPPDPFGAAMVSNVGTFGLKFGFAPLTPQSRCPIVIVTGAITDQAVVQNGAVVIKPMMTLGITVDHRIMDGYLSGLTGNCLKDFIENPEKLI